MTDMTLPQDARFMALEAWLATLWPGEAAPELTVASADASFRRYFRVHRPDGTLIAMDAPPERENSAAFLTVAEQFAAAGLHVPAILHSDLRQGFMVLEDLGTQTYLHVINDDNADALFFDAINALVAMQAASRPEALPEYSREDLRREMQLFPDWYLSREVGVTLDAAEQAVFDAACDVILDRVMAQARVFVHRDFMPRNLMVSQPNPGVIDFQDARYGPLAYDLLSLFKDAFISWPQARIDGWVAQYWQAGQAAGLPLPASLEALREDLDWMGLQRHLKVVGIFARIAHRDGKPHYLGDVPRFAAYLRPVLRRLPEMAALSALVDRYLPEQDV